MARLGLLLFLASFALAQDEPKPDAKKDTVAMAVIVHVKNPVSRLSFSELRAYLKMERKFWPNRKRCQLYLPARRTLESSVLEKKIYKMSHRKLQKYWARKLFSGEIIAKPSYVPNAKAAGSRVSGKIGAISIVRADKVPPKVKVLLIDGKKPTEKGYALVSVNP